MTRAAIYGARGGPGGHEESRGPRGAERCTALNCDQCCKNITSSEKKMLKI